MMRKHPVRTAALAIAAALALSACGKSDDSAATQANTDVQAIKDAETKMQAGFKDKNVEQVVAFYASSASFFAPGQTPSKGADVLRYVFRQMLGDPAAALSFQADRVEVSAAGDLGYSRLYSVPVSEILLPRLGSTLLLTGTAFVLGMALAARPASRGAARLSGSVRLLTTRTAMLGLRAGRSRL